ncbi:MAG: right-handed parallel beta-helix repeat-containing protein [Hydrogenovibrio sp.]
MSRQLYVDGVRATRARTGDYPGGFWPYYGYNPNSPANSDAAGILYIPLQNMDGSLAAGWPDPNTWQNVEDIEAVALPQWKMQRVPLKGIIPFPDYHNTHISVQDALQFYEHEFILDDLGAKLDYDLSRTGLIQLEDTAWRNANLYLNPEKTATNLWSFFRVAFFENAYAFLDEPGEWYLDQKADTLYYIPLDGQDMRRVQVEMPQLEQLLTVQGRQDAPVKNIRFQNLNFAYATWLEPSGEQGYISDQSGNRVTGTSGDYNTIGHVQSVVETPGNIELEYVDGVVFQGNIFEHLGAVALHFGTGTQNALIEDNLFEDISASAIWLGGVQQDDYAPDAVQLTANNTIRNNLIRHIGQEYYDVAGIYVGFSRNTHIDHNTIMYTPWSAIAMGWGWGLLDPGINLGLATATPNMWGVHTEFTPNRHNKVTHNRTYATLQQLWDGGGIYTTGYQGTSMDDALLIEGNVFSDKNPERGGNTVYSDGMSRFIKVRNNVMYNNPQAKAFFGTDIGENDPFYTQYAIY